MICRALQFNQLSMNNEASTMLIESTVPKTCLSSRQVARYLRVGLSKVLGWIRTGDLHAVDVGRPGRAQYRILPDALSAFLEGRNASKPRSKPRRRGPRPKGWIERY